MEEFLKQQKNKVRIHKGSGTVMMQEVISKTRKPNSKNVAKNAIQLNKGFCNSAIVHTMINSNILILLNKENLPIKCWNDYSCILPLPSHTVKTEKFNEILKKYNPKIIYINNGKPIADYLQNNSNVNVIFNKKSIAELLETLKLEYQQKNEPKKITLSYSDAKSLDSKLTYNEYKLLFH